MPFIGQLGEAGLAKESVLGTAEAAPVRYRRFIPPFNFSTDINLLEGQGVSGVADLVRKVAQGAGQLKSGKIKYELDPEEVGDDLMAAFGTDTPTETASFTVVAHTAFTVTLNTNDYIDFTEDGGGEVSAHLTAGTYTLAGLLAEIKTRMEAVGSGTYTVSFSTTTKKFTIAKDSGVFVILWNSGTNNAKAADTLLGFAADTASSISATSPTAITYAETANDAIPFTEDGGSEVTAFLTAGTYAIGTTSATSGTLCKLIKDQLESANGTIATYTVTYSYSTKKITITKNSGVFVLKWTTGLDAGISAMTLLGFTADSASAIAATSDSTTADFVMSHAFSRLQNAVLPSYTWWQKNGVNYPQHAGCMLSKLEFDIKAKEFVIVDCDWLGLKYDGTGITHAATYSSRQPFKFDMCIPSIAGSPVTNYDDLKVTIDNQVAVEHVVSNTIYGTKIYSKGMKVTVSFSMIVEDTTEWAKFIAGTSTSFSIAMTSTELIKAGFPYSLALSIPALNYSAAPFPISKDLIKIVFTGVGVYGTGVGYTILPTLVNGYGSAY